MLEEGARSVPLHLLFGDASVLRWHCEGGDFTHVDDDSPPAIGLFVPLQEKVVGFDVVMKKTILVHSLDSVDDVRHDVEPSLSRERRRPGFDDSVEGIYFPRLLVAYELHNE